MSGRDMNLRCVEPGCTEHRLFPVTARPGTRYRCPRHMNPDKVLSPSSTQREQVLTAGRSETRLELTDLIWRVEGERSGIGFQFGPGYKAFANDFPEGTRLVVTARIELPEEPQP